MAIVDPIFPGLLVTSVKIRPQTIILEKGCRRPCLGPQSLWLAVPWEAQAFLLSRAFWPPVLQTPPGTCLTGVITLLIHTTVSGACFVPGPAAHRLVVTAGSCRFRKCCDGGKYLRNSGRLPRARCACSDPGWGAQDGQLLGRAGKKEECPRLRYNEGPRTGGTDTPTGDSKQPRPHDAELSLARDKRSKGAPGKGSGRYPAQRQEQTGCFRETAGSSA